MKIVFVYDPEYADRASSYMRTHLLKEIYDTYYKDNLVEVKSITEARSIKNSVVIVNKNCTYNLSTLIKPLDILHEQNQKVYLDIIDKKIDPGLLVRINCVITSSLKQEICINRHYPTLKTQHIIHPTDEKSGHVDNNHLTEAKICYWGGFHNTHLDMLGVNYLNAEKNQSTEEVREFLNNHNVHLGARVKNRWDGFKPFTKGFIASKCNSIIITSSNDSDARYYLGDDYPFYTKDTTRESCEDMVKYVIDSYDSDKWKSALKIMNRLRKITSDKIIATQIRNTLL